MIEDIAGAVVEGLADASLTGGPDRRKRPGCWWALLAVMVVVAIFVIIALLKQ